jgi:hypothetical protein
MLTGGGCRGGGNGPLYPNCKNGLDYYADPAKHDPCLSVGYSIIGNTSDMHAPQYKRYHDLMKIFTENNDNFVYNRDVRPMTAGGQQDMMDYFNTYPNKTMYSVLFCHEKWEEDLTFTTLNTSADDLYDFDKSVEERTNTQSQSINWKFPCKFEHEDHGEKDMWVYFMFFNATISPNNMYTSIDKPMKPDPALMALKLGLDNALLQYKANQKGLGWIPKIK